MSSISGLSFIYSKSRFLKIEISLGFIPHASQRHRIKTVVCTILRMLRFQKCIASLVFLMCLPGYLKKRIVAADVHKATLVIVKLMRWIFRIICAPKKNTMMRIHVKWRQCGHLFISSLMPAFLCFPF